MAEYCLACWNKMHRTDYQEGDVEMSECLYICEGCERYTWVVMCTPEERESYWTGLFTWPFELAFGIIVVIGRGVRGVYRYCKKKKEKKRQNKPSA